MLDDRSAHPYLQALKERHKLALQTFFVIMVLLGVGAFLTRQYSASAVVALNPRATLNANGHPRSAVEVAWSTLTDKQIASLIDQFQLDTGLTELRTHNRVFTYVRSNISLHEIPSPGGGPPAIVVSYTGSGESAVVDVTNALALNLAQAKIPIPQLHLTGAETPLSQALDQARSNLKLLSQGQNGQVFQAQLQAHLKTGAQLEDARHGDVIKLAALEQESERTMLAASKARGQQAPPEEPDPARLALQREINGAQTRLADLRQRYTEEYPDIQDAKEKLADLEAKLNHLPVQKPQPRPLKALQLAPEQAALLQQQDDLRADQARLEEQIQNNQKETEALRQRISGEKNLAQDYAWEQQHYNSLLKAQSAASAPQNGSDDGTMPLFVIVKSATTAGALGLSVQPLFWILSLLAALLAAGFSVFLAELYAPADDAPAPSRSLHPL